MGKLELLREDRSNTAYVKAGITRRELIRRGAAMAAGAAALGTVPSILAACNAAGSPTPAPGTSAPTTAPGASASPTPAASGPNAVLSQLYPGDAKTLGQGVTIKDGMNLAVTGAGAFYGRVMSRGAQLAAKQILAQGGPTFEIIVADHNNGDPSASVQAVQRLISLNSITTLQTSYGAASEAIIPLIQQHKVLTFNGGGSSPGQLNQDFLWMTRMLSGFDSISGALAWIAKAHPEVKNLIAVGTKENQVEAVDQKLPHDWPILRPDGKLLPTEWATVGQTDFATIVARVKASNADAVYTTTFGPDQGYLVKQLREGGYKGLIISSQGERDAYDASAKTMDDNFYFSGDFFDTGNPNPFTVQFVEAHKKEYGEDPEFFGANYYEHVIWIWDLMQRVIAKGGNPTDGQQLEDELKANPKFPSVYGGTASTVGTVGFDLADHTISKPMGVYSYIGAVAKLVQEIKKTPLDSDPHTALVG